MSFNICLIADVNPLSTKLFDKKNHINDVSNMNQ